MSQIESVLRGLASSGNGNGHSPELRKAFLAKYLSTGSLYDAVTSVAEVTGLLRMFLEWVLVETDQTSDHHQLSHLVDHGKVQFARLAGLRQAEFRDAFVNPNLIIDIFTNSLYSNKAETAEIVGIILDLLKAQTGPIEDSQQDDKIRSVTNATRSHLERFLKDHGVGHLPVAAALGDLYRRHPELLPATPEARTRLANSVVRMLAGFRTPSVISDEFLDQAERFSRVLALVWSVNSSLECVNECLHTYYNVISTGDSYSRPSCALLCIIDKIPGVMLDSAMQAMIDSSANNDEGRTVAALQTMIEWLTQRPSPLLSKRLLDLLKGLHRSNRNSVLIEITHATTEKLLQSLPVSKLQDSVEPIFFYLLLGFQHSETVFHQLVTSLPDVFKQLTKSANVQQILNKFSESKSQLILDRLAEATSFLIHHQFIGFPELYADVEPWIAKSKLKDKPLTPERIEELKNLSWLSSCSYVTELPLGTSSSFPSTSTCLPKSERSDSSSSAKDQRSATGMVGLVNLGNTCYMNSVLQALYITKAFCELVLAAAPPSPTGTAVPPHTGVNHHQPVLAKLQVTFSFLKNTMRSIYSPSELLKAARPPWFETGRQQDCSEFLRYLLDTLHEQEKSSFHHQSKASSVNRLTVVAPSSSSSHRTTNRLHQQHSAMDEDHNEAKVRPSFSTTALDSISEDPVEENSGGENEPGLNNSSSGKSDHSGDKHGCSSSFGSRSSLSGAGGGGGLGMGASTGTTGIDSEDSDEDDDMMLTGSRGSLMSARGGGGGSGGLNRWTTEENLSFDGGSREDKMDTLVDGPFLHDSHSNSTDSGIQSVGDSIRGSSDSVTNKEQAAAAGCSSSQTSQKQPPVTISVSKPMAPPPPPQVHQQAAAAPSTPSFSSIVDKVFGGKMETTYTCSQCEHESRHKETFTDLNLAFPNTSTSEKGEDDKEAQLSVQDLLSNYLSPEKLCGDNQYRCDGCDGLRDAVKRTSVTEPPSHLMTTLLRFNYDRAHNRKSKVCRDLKYDLSLRLPVVSASEEASSTEEEAVYRLYAIVVHSGYSSDGGHYYTYAREPGENGEEEEGGGQWYVFNDSKVSFTTFASFVKLSERFPVDTAYVLFYQRKGFKGFTTAGKPRAELNMAVERDNIKFMREKERGGSGSSLSSSVTSQGASWQRRKDDNDEDQGGGSSGYSSCGGNSGFNAGPGRFIC